MQPALLTPAPPPVVPFQEVWGRSYCRALERLVDVVEEFPSEVEHMFSPSCVPLLRCTGCCGDENLHCVPVRTANVTMQVSTPIQGPAGRSGPTGHSGPTGWLGPRWAVWALLTERSELGVHGHIFVAGTPQSLYPSITAAHQPPLAP